MSVREAGARSRLIVCALVAAACLTCALARADVKPLAARVGVDEQIGAALPNQLRVRDHTGRSLRMAELLAPDKPLLLALAYYHCPGLCDVSLRELASSLRGLGWSLGKDYEALTVSIDPHDTPAGAAAKRANVLKLLHLEESAVWPFSVTDADNLAKLTQRIGYRYDYDAPTKQYAHPAVSVVLTPEGKVARYLYGPSLDADTVGLALREARLGRGGATALIDRTVLSCFQYDPATHRYSVVILGVMRIGAALIAVALALFVFVFVRRGRARRASS